MVNRVGRTLRDCTPGSRIGSVIVNFGTRLHANPQIAQKMHELAAQTCWSLRIIPRECCLLFAGFRRNTGKYRAALFVEHMLLLSLR